LPRGWFEEEVTRVKKLLFASLAACMLASMSMLSVPAVAADSDESLICEMEIDVFWTIPAHWEGTITGDVEGSIEFWEVSAKVVGVVDHFSEDFTIVIDGTTITGYDTGVYTFNTLKFRANGFVTDVTPSTSDWAYLVGYKFHEMGTTTAFTPGEPVHGTATMMLSPD
jgi:hypothetical protein